jgi:predicted Rdx family selenoprotein
MQHTDPPRSAGEKHGRRFPEAKELKQLVRDRVARDKDLGHSVR